MARTRNTLFAFPLLAVAAGLGLPAHAQAPTEAAAREPGPGPGQRIQRISHEDALTRVDELRVGGETRSITVQPKNGAPAYEIVTTPGRDDPTDPRAASAGKSRWRLLSF